MKQKHVWTGLVAVFAALVLAACTSGQPAVAQERRRLQMSRPNSLRIWWKTRTLCW